MTLQIDQPAVRSMTGYARAAEVVNSVTYEVEVRSLNSRYLDLNLRLCDDWRDLENLVRERVGRAVSRGKVEVRVSRLEASDLASARVDDNALAHLRALQEAVRLQFPTAAPLTTQQVLTWPGVQLGATGLESEAAQSQKLALLDQTLSEHRSFREREGAALAQLIVDRSHTARSCVDRAEPIAKRAELQFGDRLRAKIAQAGITPDPERLAQEIVIQAQRLDVDEECGRLRAHLDALEALVRPKSNAAPVGKKLDFLIQELNREANTLGSKAGDLESTRIAMELKVLFEQIREQVQNIE